MYIPHFCICSSTDGHLGCFHGLAIVNNTVMLLWVHKYQFGILFSIILGIYPDVELLTHMVIYFLRNYHNVFHRGYTILHSHQQCKRAPFSSHPYQHLLLSDFLTVAILTGMQWHLILSPRLDQQLAVQHSRVAYWGSRWVSNWDNTSGGWGAGLQDGPYVWNHRATYQYTLLLLIAGMETMRWKWDSLSVLSEMTYQIIAPYLCDLGLCWLGPGDTRAYTTQFSSVVQSCPTLCDPMDCSMPGLPVYHQFPEPTQTYVHWVGDAIQLSHPLSSPSPPTFNLSPASGSFQMSQFFASGGQSIDSLSFNISPSNEYSGLVSFRMDWLDLLAVQGTLKSLLQHLIRGKKCFQCWSFGAFMPQTMRWKRGSLC